MDNVDNDQQIKLQLPDPLTKIGHLVLQLDAVSGALENTMKENAALKRALASGDTKEVDASKKINSNIRIKSEERVGGA